MTNMCAEYAQLIVAARNGCPTAETALRDLLVAFSGNMPIGVLLAVSEVVLAARRQELKDAAESN